MTNNFQINTVCSDLLSKVHYHFDNRLWEVSPNLQYLLEIICHLFQLIIDNGLWKVSPNRQYLFGNYLSSLPINKIV